MQQAIVRLDVRDLIRAGGEPFSKIIQTVNRLKGDEQLLLVAPFEPEPLYRVLAQHGFSRQAKPIGGGDWEVLFTRVAPARTAVEPPGRSEQSAPPANGAHAKQSVVNVDARGLEPPQPMVQILEALASVPPDAEVWARTDRRPMHLYPMLEQRGWSGQTEELADGSFVTHIRRG